MLRIALRAEGRTIVRLLDALQNLTADADLGLVGIDLLHVEKLFRIVIAELPAQLVTAFWNGAYSAPLAIGNFKDVGDKLLRRLVPFPVQDARVFVLDLGTSALELADRHQRSLQNVQRLESVMTMGTLKRALSGSYSRYPMTAQTCPGPRNPCTRFSGDCRMAAIAGGTRT